MEIFSIRLTSNPLEYWTEGFFSDRGFHYPDSPSVQGTTVSFTASSEDDPVVRKAIMALESANIPYEIVGITCWSCSIGSCTKHVKSP